VKKRDYSLELKEQILVECQEVGSVSLVAGCHDMSATLFTAGDEELR
jgi:transposase-like protein